MKTIAIVNQKGGCGKTTTAINVAGVLAKEGFRTLLVDLDPQSHCAAGLAIPEQRIDLDIGDAMLAPPEQAIEPSRLLWRASRNLDLAPSRMKLAGLEAARGGLADRPDKERRLAGVLSRFSRNYDVCLVDCSPSIGLLTYNALAAADEVVIPVETGFFSLQGATKQVNTIRTVGKRLGCAAPYWLVATIHDEESALARDLLEELRRRFGQRVAPVVVRRDPTLKEAASFGQPVIEYAGQSAGAKDYTDLAEWLIGAAALTCSSRPRVPERVAAPPEESFEECDPTLPPIVHVTESTEVKLGVGLRVASVDDSVPLSTAALVNGAEAVEVLPVEGAPVEGAGNLATLSRAEDLAHRARLLLLRTADERLKRVVSTQVTPVVRTTVERAPPVIFEAPATPDLAREARLTSVRSLFGCRATRSGVLFVQPLTTGRTIAVAGDFNGWSPTAHLMKPNASLGVHELCVALSPGRHLYRIVIDGRWSADPFNDHSEPNPFGELNSVIEVLAPVGAHG